MNVTSVQISGSSCVGPKAGIPVMRIPFCTTQKSSPSVIDCTLGCVRSGAGGFRPSPMADGSTVPAPWHVRHIER